MKENHLSKSTLFTAIVAILVCGVITTRVIGSDSGNSKVVDKNGASDESFRPKTKAELRKSLTPIQYSVTQNEETEPAFRNQYWNNKKEGVYHCVCCNLPLFPSDTKYKSGTGWPSFWAPKAKENVGFRNDFKLFYTRVEVHCKRCGAHLGHVFDDGPKPTGKRYCMNSAALKFLDKDSVKKESQKQAAAKTDEKEKL